MTADILPAGRRVESMQVTVADVVVETADTVTLVFDAPVPCDYRGGQYLTIDPHQFLPLLRFTQLFEILKKRKEPPRAYSMASAPHEPLAITIKEERWTPGREKYPTLLSPFLVHDVAVGTTMTVAGFTGRVLPARRHREPNGSRGPPVFRLGRRAELVDPEGGAGRIPAPSPHLAVCEHGVG